MARIVCLALSASILLSNYVLSQAPTNQKQPVQTVPRQLIVTKVQIEPLLIEERDVLYDASKPSQVKLEIVFSQRPARAVSGTGLGGQIGGQTSDENSLPGWMQQQQTKLKELAKRKYREITGDDKAEPTIPMSYAGVPRGEELLKEGYRWQAGKDHIASGAWAVLYAKVTPPPEARLGDITKKVTVLFSPTITAKGVVHLNSSHKAEITPAQAPAGVNAGLWQREHEREVRLASQQAAWMLVHWINLWRIRAPKDAEVAFTSGQPFPMTRGVRFWGKERPVQLRLEGQLKLEIDKPLDQQPPGQQKKNGSVTKPPHFGFRLASNQLSQEHPDILHAAFRPPLGFALNQADRGKANPVVPVSRDVPNISGMYWGDTPSKSPCPDDYGFNLPCPWSVKVVQEGRKIRIIVAAVHERITKAFGWQVGDEVFRGEVGLPGKNPVTGGWPITGQLHYRYYRLAKPKFPTLSDFWAESAGEYSPDFLVIYGRDGAQDRLPYETSGKPYERSQPYEFSRSQAKTKPAAPETSPAELIKPILEQFNIFNPDEPQSRNMVWTGEEDEVGLIASYEGDKKADDVKQAIVRIERGSQIIYRFPQQQTKLPYDPEALGGIVYHSTLKLNSATQPKPGVQAYEFKPGDVLVAALEGHTSRLTLLSSEATLLTYPFARYEKVPPMVYGGLRVEVASQLEGVELPKPQPNSRATQTILVLGREIQSENGEYKLESADKSIRYVFLAAKDPDHRLRYNGSFGPGRSWADLFSQAVEGVPREFRDVLGYLDAILIRAEMDGGLTGGFKHLILNGHKVDWFLNKGTSTAELRFVRDLPQRGTEATTHLFLWDAFRLEIRTSDPVPANELPINLFTGEQQLNVSGAPLVAKREPADPMIFRTGPIFVDIPGAQNAFRKQYTSSIAPQRGTVLTALTGLDDEFVSPPVCRVRIESDPTELRVSWQNALNEAQRQAGIPTTEDISAQTIDKISKLIWTEFGSRKVNVTIGHLAAMILLRRTFMKQMEEYLDDMPQNPAKFPLDQWRAELKTPMRDPNFPVGSVEVTTTIGVAIDHKVPFHQTFNKEYLDRIFGGVYQHEQDWIKRATVEAYTNWRNAVLDSLVTARDVKTYSPQTMIELTGSGFEPVAAILKPLLVKAETIPGQEGYRWVPDIAARDYVDTIPFLSKEVRANNQLADASRNVVLTTASLAFFAPASLATRIVCGALTMGFSFEAGSVIAEYTNAQDELKFARGASAVLAQDRLEMAQIREIPGWAPVLSVIGAAAGFGGETLACLTHISRSQALARGTELLASLHGDTFKAFASLSKEDQAAVLILISDARTIRQNPVSSLTGLHRKALEIGAEIERKTSYKKFLDLLDIAELPGFRPVVTIAESEFRTGTNLVAKHPLPGMPPVGSEFSFINEQGELQKAVLETLLGRGRYAHVYTIKDQPSKVLKIYRDVEGWLEHMIDGEPTRTWGISRSATDSVETSTRLSKMLEKKGIPQLKILSSDAKAQRPYTVQERLKGDMVRFNYAVEETPAGGRVIGLEGGKKLSAPLQRALLRLFKKFASGNDPLIWEDSHIENVYFFRNTRNEWEAGVLDQDRIARWNALKEEPKTFRAAQLVMDTPGVEPCRIYSLSKFKRPPNDEALLLAGTPTFPNADFFMEKTLELRGRYIKFNLETGQFEDFILDMRIVEEPEFFPNIRKHVNIDLSKTTPSASGSKPSAVGAKPEIKPAAPRPGPSTAGTAGDTTKPPGPPLTVPANEFPSDVNPFQRRGLRTRENSIKGDGFEGVAVSTRLKVSDLVQGSKVVVGGKPADGMFMYVIDSEGNMYIHPTGRGIDLKHDSLLRPGQEVHSAGGVEFKNGKPISIDAGSGHYMREDPFLGAESSNFIEAVKELFQNLGLEVPSKINPGPGLR